MASKSCGGNLQVDVLAISHNGDAVRCRSDRHSVGEGVAFSSDSPRRQRKKRTGKGKTVIDKNVIVETSVISNDVNYTCAASTVTETALAPDSDGRDTCTVRAVIPLPKFSESRQSNVRNVMNGESAEMVTSEESGDCKKDEMVEEEIMEDCTSGTEISSDQQAELMGKQLEEGNADWKILMDKDLNEKSPMHFFLEEINAGNSLRSTTTAGNENERERVYDTIFRLPWRCELLINFGFFVCFDSFLSLLTIMPIRTIISLGRLLKTRQFKRPSSAEFSDFGCLVVMLSGVNLLQQADISLIYHMIRSQGVVKLYVVYNVLEIFDKLFQSFGGEVLQSLFNSADGLANSSHENLKFWLWRFISDEAVAVFSSIIHSFILLVQAITLSTCIVSHNNALFAMLVSNNFAEIKSNIFKRYSKDNVQSLVYFDSVERFHISAFVLFVLAQNILEAESPWFESFICNVLVVFICEVIIDVVKHSLIAKFNDIKPIVFSEFLEDLCKQTLDIQTENGKTLTFVPLAPACLVIRVLRPVYAAHLPCNPFLWRLFWIVFLFVMTFMMLASLKMMIGMGLRKTARWYIKRCRRRKLHTD